MQIWALLKGLEDVATFHGIVTTEDAADAWKSGSSDNWHYSMDTNDGAVILCDPITYDAAENGTLE